MGSLSFLGISTPAALNPFNEYEVQPSVAVKRLRKKCEGGLKGA
jgi:hypothetical protein